MTDYGRMTQPDGDRAGSPKGELTLLIEQARDGGDAQVEALIVAVYKELRRTAAGMVRREARGFSLMATDVVHEVFLRLFGDSKARWKDRQHFFRSAAVAMRRVLIDHARFNKAGKRIPKNDLVPIEAAVEVFEFPDIDLLALDIALTRLAEKSPRQAQIVELRYFAGLSEAEIAEVLEISRMTVGREWRVARLRLRRDMYGEAAGK